MITLVLPTQIHSTLKKKDKLIICITICCDLQIGISIFKFHKICILENTVSSSEAILSVELL